MNTVLRWLDERWHRPYPGNPTNRAALRHALGTGLFVGVFLSVFRPFGMDQWTYPNTTWIIAGYGPVGFVGVFASHIIARGAVPHSYKTRRWTVGREVVYQFFLVSLCALLIMVYSSLAKGMPITWYKAWCFWRDTFLVAIFPIVGTIFIREYYLLKQSEQLSGQLNEELHALEETQGEARIIPLNDEVTLTAEEGRESYTFRLSDLLYVMAEGNYVELLLRRGEGYHKVVLRTTLKSVEETLAPFPSLFRCHRSYLVNLPWINHVSGNSQGLLLSLHHYPEPVPVSRSRTEALRERLAQAVPA